MKLPVRIMEKYTICTAGKYLIDAAKEVGLTIDGFKHEVTSDFKNHVINHHGDSKAEASRGQIGITEADFDDIPAIVQEPDYLIVGAKSEGKDMIAYAKTLGNGTTLYFEEILDSKRNKSLRSKTMYKRRSATDGKKLWNILSNGRGTDMTGAKIIGLGGTGGNPDSPPPEKQAAAAANSAKPPGRRSAESSAPL